MDQLETLSCKPLLGVEHIASPELLEEALKQLEGWGSESEGRALRREYVCETFSRAMEFVNKVADLAEEQDHHPRIAIDYRKVELELTTHDAGGVTMNDFILAAHISRLAETIITGA